jgi:hypothetical protein
MVENSSQSGLGLSRRGVYPRPSLVPSHVASLSPSLRRLILTPLALFLVWEVVTRSLVAYLADTNPDFAIRLRSNYSTALLNVANDTLVRDPSTKTIDPVTPLPRDDSNGLTIVAKGVQTAKDIDLKVMPEPTSGRNTVPVATDSRALAQIRSWTERALIGDPLNARAFRILGQLSRGASQADFMEAAARHSLYESEAIYWLMREKYEDGDYRAAGRYAEILLRTQPSSQKAVDAAMVVLGRIAETPTLIIELKQLLASNPRWRSQFFSSLPASVSDARAPLQLMLALKDTAAPPTTAEVRAYIKFLIEHEFYDLAYYTWLQFLPPEQLNKAGNLFNGDFEVVPTGLPFDWTFSTESGATIEIAERTDEEGGHALFLEFGVGRVEDLSVSQLVILPPGDYQFEGTYKADIVSQRGLQWRVVCKSSQVIGEGPMVIGAKSDWSDFKFSFTVPATSCPAQTVELGFNARSASEQFISGSVWFDDLKIARETTASP